MSASLEIRSTERPQGLAGQALALWPILRFAGPLTAFYLIQSAVSLATLAVLGRLGNAVLAGVGAAGVLYGVVLALTFGIDAAVQATVSRRTGAGRRELMGQVLADAHAVSLPLGLAIAVLIWFGGPALVAAVLPNAQAAAIGGSYLQAQALSLVFLGATIPINSCWIGQGRPGRSFLVQAIQAPIQIGATIVLVLGVGPIPSLGAAGAGWANSLAALVPVGLQLFLASRPDAIPGFLRHRPSLQGAKAIAALGWPISLQQSLLQLGLMLSVVIVARLGVAQLAAGNVIFSLVGAPTQLSVGVGVAAGVLVGQSLGRGDVAEARRWGWRGAGVALAIGAPFVLAGLFFTRPVFGAFLHDPSTLALAILPARLANVAVVGAILALSLCFAIRGAGATRIGAAIPFAAQWFATLPLWWLAVVAGYDLVALTGVQAGVALAEAAVTALFWAGSRWTVHRTLSRPV